MHIADHANGNLGANAIVGGSAGIATGAAFSAKRRGTDQVAVVLLRRGSARPGAALRGDEHGVALDAAGGLRLREQPLQRVHALPRGDGGRRCSRRAARLRDRGRARSTARTCAPSTRQPRELVERARRGEGPAFLLCNTYRYHGHHVGDVDRAYYRSKDEEELWRSERDPLDAARRVAASSRASRTRTALARVAERGARRGRRRRAVRARRSVPRAERGDRRCLRLASTRRRRRAS